ncbi:MAG: hypothetical protein FD123_3393 [Bacteroidetes bacterium]|nr:MAG: hypothetical protein FD123_3393 [Bacteroidota bacterium]
MKAKTMLQLLTIGSNLYLISRDKELMDKLSELLADGKEKLDEFLDSDNAEGEEKTLHKLLRKAKEAEKEFEHKIGEFVERSYEKMRIAHTNEIVRLQAQIDELKKELEKRPVSEQSGS